MARELFAVSSTGRLTLNDRFSSLESTPALNSRMKPIFDNTAAPMFNNLSRDNIQKGNLASRLGRISVKNRLSLNSASIKANTNMARRSNQRIPQRNTAQQFRSKASPKAASRQTQNRLSRSRGRKNLALGRANNSATLNGTMNNSRRSRGRGAINSRGGRRNAGRGRRGRPTGQKPNIGQIVRKDPSKRDQYVTGLDKQLDSYMSTSRGKLDKDLDVYMQSKNDNIIHLTK